MSGGGEVQGVGGGRWKIRGAISRLGAAIVGLSKALLMM